MCDCLFMQTICKIDFKCAIKFTAFKQITTFKFKLNDKLKARKHIRYLTISYNNIHTSCFRCWSTCTINKSVIEYSYIYHEDNGKRSVLYTMYVIKSGISFLREHENDFGQN